MDDRQRFRGRNARVLELFAHPIAAHGLAGYGLFEEKAVLLDPAERSGQAQQTLGLGGGRLPESLDDPLRPQSPIAGLHLATGRQRSGRCLHRVEKDGADLLGVAYALDLDIRERLQESEGSWGEPE